MKNIKQQWLDAIQDKIDNYKGDSPTCGNIGTCPFCILCDAKCHRCIMTDPKHCASCLFMDTYPKYLLLQKLIAEAYATRLDFWQQHCRSSPKCQQNASYTSQNAK
jgi:hypothetical protein